MRFRQRMARLRLEPGRVKEIQQALGKAGYLNQEPNGNWDDLTRNAMRRYQADHNFPTTGMPEAKSLLKLGLGSHPLPPEVDPSAQTQTQPSTEAPGETTLPVPDPHQAVPADSGSPPSQQ
jgi:peptidoglycan hydrolase-like protein with peptidoglycan-binding domain